MRNFFEFVILMIVFGSMIFGNFVVVDNLSNESRLTGLIMVGILFSFPFQLLGFLWLTTLIIKTKE